MTDHYTRTELLQLLLDAWRQWAIPRKGGGLWAGGLSTLEEIEEVLRGEGLIDEKGEAK